MSEKAGVADKAGYYGLGAVFVDINNDGKPDLLVGERLDAQLSLPEQGRRDV